MDIFKFAMKMEKDGERYYRELMNRTDNEGLRKILSLLANEEINHYQIIEQMNQGSGDTISVETTVLKDAKNIFIQMKESKQDVLSVEGEVDLYTKAKEIEKASRIFYAEKAQETNNEQHKQIFLRLSEEEKKHEFLMDNLVEFITRPDTWLENAEWHHLDEY